MGVSGQLHDGTALCGPGAALDGFLRRKKVSGFDHRTTRPLASRCSNCDILAPAEDGVYCKKTYVNMWRSSRNHLQS